MAGLTESQFYIWRTLFAVAHADDVVTSEEIRFMAEALEDIPFSPEQKSILREDIKIPQSIEAMFGQISDVRDQAAFFQYARTLVHVDGDYGADEQSIMLKLKKSHLKNPRLAELIGQVDLELEDDLAFEDDGNIRNKRDGFKEIVVAFRKRLGKDALPH